MSDPTKKNSMKITEMFEQGKAFTQEVIKENERLRMVIADQNNKLRSLESERGCDFFTFKEKVNDLDRENRALIEELEDIKAQYNDMEKENWDFSERYLNVEHQNTSLLNLYVASQMLHSSLSFGHVIRAVNELVVNLIGSEAFRICLWDRGHKELITISSMGTNLNPGDSSSPSESIQSVLDSGQLWLAEEEAIGQGNAGVVPLKIGGEVFGVILIETLLYHKTSFVSGDSELFEMLGEHAAAALLASHLMTKHKNQDTDKEWSQTIDDMATAAKNLDWDTLAIEG